MYYKTSPVFRTASPEDLFKLIEWRSKLKILTDYYDSSHDILPLFDVYFKFWLN